MTGYIIQPWDFTVVRSVNVTDYDLPLECYSGESGSVTFEGKSKQDYSQYLFRLDVLDTMWKIKEAETGDALSTKLAVTDVTGVLDGAYTSPHFDNSIYSTTLTETLANNIIGIGRNITSGGWDVQRNRYMYPYIQNGGVTMPTLLAPAALKTADYLLFSKNLSGERQVVTDLYKLATDLVACGAVLKLTIGARRQGGSTIGRALLPSFTEAANYSVATPVYFKDGHSYLLSESYDGDVCSCYIGLPSSPSIFPQQFTYYLDENMQVVQNKAEQINGYTKAEIVSDNADALTKATAAFGQNQWKHKVEFASDKVFHLNQPVKLMLERNVLNTAISKVTIKSGDDRYYYTCGELPQTAAQHIRANSWSYGKRLPHNPYIGQLAFV